MKIAGPSVNLTAIPERCRIFGCESAAAAPGLPLCMGHRRLVSPLHRAEIEAAYNRLKRPDLLSASEAHKLNVFLADAFLLIARRAA